uniref:CHK kinase-like domain-containing protein n=1 Tax=Megaselia scalaris TaxID=36166 RepID=T1GGK0_MEGSC
MDRDTKELEIPNWRVTARDPPILATNWIKPQLFENEIRKVFGSDFRIVEFNIEPGTSAGENYAYKVQRIKIKVSKKEKGVEIAFGPRFVELPNLEIEHVLLEDLKTQGFKNTDRLKGFDMDHIENVLNLMAKFHSASAVVFETKGPFSEELSKGAFNSATKNAYTYLFEWYEKNLEPCMRSFYKNGSYFADRFLNNIPNFMDELMSIGQNESFKVLNHGDCWGNNIMFNYDSQGKVRETKFIDFQVPKYCSPVYDLYYFLISSASLELKFKHFNFFV